MRCYGCELMVPRVQAATCKDLMPLPEVSDAHKNEGLEFARSEREGVNLNLKWQAGRSRSFIRDR